jgi:hypothetical protein
LVLGGEVTSKIADKIGGQTGELLAKVGAASSAVGGLVQLNVARVVARGGVALGEAGAVYSVAIFAAGTGGWGIGRAIDYYFLTDEDRELIGYVTYQLVYGDPFSDAYKFYKDLLLGSLREGNIAKHGPCP